MEVCLPPDADNRSDNRSNVFLTAVLVGGPEPLPVRVRNLSPGGAFVDGAGLPPRGTNVRLVRGSLGVAGEVAWQDDGHAGLRFAKAIEVAAWVKRVGHNGQHRVDHALDALRHHQRPTASADPPSLTRISADLDAICDRLSASPSMSVEVGEELVRLDALARALQQMAEQTPR